MKWLLKLLGWHVVPIGSAKIQKGDKLLWTVTGNVYGKDVDHIAQSLDDLMHNPWRGMSLIRLPEGAKLELMVLHMPTDECEVPKEHLADCQCPECNKEAILW